MAATVKPIEAKIVHQIQSGQVIVDLCSVVKELVENSLDANATSVEIRFKNNGLDEIEVQDNGSGIAATNYESVALKHHTSKLSTYDDLEKLSTFGFRGEALASLCALSDFHITTALAEEAPKGHRLEFETSGKLKTTTVVACQKGTIATVGNLFESLPVRRKELAKNIKREYGKVLGLLHAYACISTNVKFTVKNLVSKGKSTTVFTTKANATTRENIANVYGAKTLSALAPLDLKLHMDTDLLTQARKESNHIVVKGHISRPVFGEGRLTPDRQMFFVNGRPCGLPQVAKAINEVYKSFNASQSPFIFANLQMDTSAYDVNVSPDKRSIFLHNASALIESLKEELTSMFDNQEQTVPQSILATTKPPALKQLTVHRMQSNESTRSRDSLRSPEDLQDTDETDDEPASQDEVDMSPQLFHAHFRNLASTRDDPSHGKKRHVLSGARIKRGSSTISSLRAIDHADRSVEVPPIADRMSLKEEDCRPPDHTLDSQDSTDPAVEQMDLDSFSPDEHETQIGEKDGQIASKIVSSRAKHRPPPPTAGIGVVQTAFDRMRPKRVEPELATMTIGDSTFTKMIRTSAKDSNDTRVKVSRESRDLGIDQEQSSALHRYSHDNDRSCAAKTMVYTEKGGTQQISDNRDDLAELDDGNEPASEADHATRPGKQIGTPAIGTNRSAEYRQQSVDSGSDSDYVDEEEEKSREEARVADLIKAAEQPTPIAKQGELARATKILNSRWSKDPAVRLALTIDISTDAIQQQILALRPHSSRQANDNQRPQTHDAMIGYADEEKLSLTVSKADFARMNVVGQFNLGFILATRPRNDTILNTRLSERRRDELFIIDQHASDEKYNFERFQAGTVVGNQRMVRPVVLDLTAVEEEVIIENHEVLEKNGFLVEIDESGDKAVGQRCQLTSLPLSREVVFNTKDLDELIHLLAESPMLSDSRTIPRPTKVRKMFAMRACRSSIMIGRTLSHRQMVDVVRHMGTIDKPWNCPHGRPTMRHLATLDALDVSLWQEGDGRLSGPDSASSDHLRSDGRSHAGNIWKQYIG